MTNNKDKYRSLSELESTISIFSKGWYLDALVGEKNWDVIIVERNNAIVASLPYWVRKKASMKMIATPPLVKFMGPWIKYPKGQKQCTRLSHEKELMSELIHQLPKVDAFSQQFHYDYSNWLPFYWEGFRQTTKFSYCIKNTSDLKLVFSDFAENIRRAIRKAEKQVIVEESVDINRFFMLNEQTFNRQEKEMPYSFDTVNSLHKAVQAHHNGKLFIAKGKNNEDHAGVYLIWDEKSVYYILGGSNETLRNSGAVSLLIWYGIQLANSLGLAFDFEGSMIPEIERFFRAFGGDLMPYHEVSKVQSKLLRAKALF